MTEPVQGRDLDQLDCISERDCAHIGNRPLRFLVITSTFPPRGGSSVQRVAKFCKYAKRLGAEPIVITARFEGGLRDETLLDDLPSDLEVHRVAESVLGARSMASRLKRRFSRAFLPDEHGTWRRAAYRKTIYLAQKHEFDAVFVSYGAPSALRLGVEIAEKLSIPVMADIRDFKNKNILNQKTIQPFGRHRQYLINRLERICFPRIDHFFAVSETYVETLSSHYEINSNSTTMIYNGYDPEDFVCRTDVTEAGFESPVIRYIGFLTHLPSFDKLLNALVKVNKARLAQKQNPVLLEIVGANNNVKLQKIVDKHSASSWCELKGYVPHGEAIKLMMSASILLLMQHGEKGVLTGKLFEYIGAGQPILLLDNDNNELKALIQEYDLGYSVKYDRIDEIEAAINRLLACQEWAREGDKPVFRRDYQAVEFLKMIKRTVMKVYKTT